MGEILNGNHSEGVIGVNGHSNGFSPEVGTAANGNEQTPDTLASLSSNGNHVESTVEQAVKVNFIDVSGLLEEIRAFTPRPKGQLPIKSRRFYPDSSIR